MEPQTAVVGFQSRNQQQLPPSHFQRLDRSSRGRRELPCRHQGSSGHGLCAGDFDKRTAHERRLIGGKEGDKRSNLFRLADPAERNHLVEVGHRPPRAFDAGFEHRRMDFTWADGVYADFVRCVVARKVLRERGDGGFGRVVGDVVRGRIKSPLRISD